ncbi:MAG: hypothetical protein V4487_05105 [Chlamydiota bacterium]
MRLLCNLFWIFALPSLLYSSQEIYLGPDCFYRNYWEKIKNGGKSQELGWLVGFQGGYELISAQIPYVGADVRFAEGTTDYDGSIQNLRTGSFSPLHSHTENTLFNLEGRVGYPFFLNHWQLIAFLGLGYDSWFRSAVDRKTGYDELFQWAYFSEGLRVYWQWNESFNIGLHLQLMQMKMGSVEIRNFFPWTLTLSLGNKCQAEIELPFSYTNKNFSMNLIPYFRWLPTGMSEIQKTRDGTFFVPATLCTVTGIRLEASLIF